MEFEAVVHHSNQREIFEAYNRTATSIHSGQATKQPTTFYEVASRNSKTEEKAKFQAREMKISAQDEEINLSYSMRVRHKIKLRLIANLTFILVLTFRLGMSENLKLLCITAIKEKFLKLTTAQQPAFLLKQAVES